MHLIRMRVSVRQPHIRDVGNFCWLTKQRQTVLAASRLSAKSLKNTFDRVASSTGGTVKSDLQRHAVDSAHVDNRTIVKPPHLTHRVGFRFLFAGRSAMRTAFL
jgi:hypothetical protein